jgi:hypothetical protein
MYDQTEHLECHRLTIVILTAALCEATINAYLALKLDKDRFGLIDRTSPVSKWTVAPRFVLPNYSIPDGDLETDLKYLFECRNAVMHAKPEVMEGQDKRHAGNWKPLAELGHSRISGLVTVPIRLAKNLADFDGRDGAMIYSSIQTSLVIRKLNSMSGDEVPNIGPRA